MPLINSKIELDRSSSKNCIISEISITPRIPANPNANPPVQKLAAINNAKPYVLVVGFSINNNIKFLEIIKQGFKRTIFWNTYTSEITTQTKSNNLEYLTDPTFRNINSVCYFIQE